MHQFDHFLSVYKLSSFRCHEKCKSGYVRDPKDGQCVPHCDGGCLNGKCVEPNKCECIQGYSATDLRKPNECHCDMYCAEIDGICECLHKDQRIDGFLIHNDTAAICTETNSSNETLSYICNCINGFESNGTCVCANGYKMRDGLTDLCEPDCGEKCNGSICIEPDLCINEHTDSTLQGLGNDEDDLQTNDPICHFDMDGIQGCGNGTCIAPDTCECYDGFENLSNITSTCVARQINGSKTESFDEHSYVLSLPLFAFFGGILLGIIATLIFWATLHFVTLCVIKDRINVLNA